MADHQTSTTELALENAVNGLATLSSSAEYETRLSGCALIASQRLVEKLPVVPVLAYSSFALDRKGSEGSD
ncbi:hypothetical protein ABTI13_19160, partial [Acinetobacter baumannii]